MARRNYPKHARRRDRGLEDRYDRDYVNLPEYPQYCSIVAVPLKTIYINMDADPRADDFYVAKSFNDPVLRKLEKKIGCGGIA